MTPPPPSFWFRALLLALLALSPFAASAAEPLIEPPKSSRSGQFRVFSDDRNLRMMVVSYAQELKDEVLRLLRDNDGWKEVPIIITLIPPSDPPVVRPVVVQWTNTPGGAKVDVVAHLNSDPSSVFLQRHLIRAMLLEMSFRGRPGPKGGEPYLMPPWWLTEGIIENLRRRETGENRDVFKSMVETQKVPPLGKWLAQPPANLDTAAGAVDRACAMCLVDALMALPGGARGLQRFISSWPASNGDALTALTKEFPSLAGSEQSLAKWWLLQMARYAGGDRLQGLTLAETDRALDAMLSFDLPVDKEGKIEKFELKDFPRFVKLPAARNAMRALQVKLVTLVSKANPLLRPAIHEYEQICMQLSVGKTRKIADRIAANQQYREDIVQRSGAITDYLNWYEATQAAGRTGSFDNFLKHAEKLEDQLVPVDPRIVEYLNGLEQDFAPVQPPGGVPEPNTFPPVDPATTVNR